MFNKYVHLVVVDSGRLFCRWVLCGDLSAVFDLRPIQLRLLLGWWLLVEGCRVWLYLLHPVVDGWSERVRV